MLLRPTVTYVGALLIGLGVILILLVFGLAFTIYGEISGVLGIACIAAGSVLVSRKGARRGS